MNNSKIDKRIREVIGCDTCHFNNICGINQGKTDCFQYKECKEIAQSNGLSKLRVEDRDKFLKELKDLLNRHNIDGICNVPDFILADMLLDTIYAVEKMQDNLTWWRGKINGD